MIDALPRGEVARPHAPLDSPFRHLKEGMEHRSHTQGARSSTAFGGGDQIFAPLPCLVSQVAWIDFFVHLPIVPTCEDFSDRLLGVYGRTREERLHQVVEQVATVLQGEMQRATSV